jgi:NTP pyrophosphatase (non-canonical NTP hydrolase)
MRSPLRIQQALAGFAAEREWEPFHTPKNLAMALAGESGELVEIFQWLTREQFTHVMQDTEQAGRVREEMADVLDVDLEQALAQKIETNRRKYPVHLARGRADKYTQLGE